MFLSVQLQSLRYVELFLSLLWAQIVFAHYVVALPFFLLSIFLPRITPTNVTVEKRDVKKLPLRKATVKNCLVEQQIADSIQRHHQSVKANVNRPSVIDETRGLKRRLGYYSATHQSFPPLPNKLQCGFFSLIIVAALVPPADSLILRLRYSSEDVISKSIFMPVQIPRLLQDPQNIPRNYNRSFGFQAGGWLKVNLERRPYEHTTLVNR